jgi:hypothetical protein
MDAALDTFYRIYDSNDRSNLVNGILNNSTSTRFQSRYLPQSHIKTSGTRAA